MAEHDDERLARIEATLAVLGERVGGMGSEIGRSRERLHDLEGATNALLTLQRERTRHERERGRRIDLRLRMLTLVVGLSGVATPIFFALLHG